MIRQFQAFLKGPKLEIPGEYDDPQDAYEGQGATAVIGIKGPLAKVAGLFERVLFGAASMRNIQKAFIDAVNDPDVARIILDVDSPGGTVDGAWELAETIYGARSKKEIITYCDGVAASAAYLIGASSSKFYIANDTVNVGSIGVLLQHVDQSEAEKKEGLHITEIYKGRYKTAGSPHKPLSEDSREYLQSRVDYIYSLFIETIAKYRGVSAADVESKMADGRVFIGQQAIEAGLVDGVSTFDALLSGGGSDIEAEFLKAYGGNNAKI